MGIRVVNSANGGGPFFDEGSVGDFFQIGSIEWEALENGVVDLVVDNELVVNGGVAIDGVTFNGLTIAVGVPEPTAAGVLTFGLVGALIRRKR